MTKSISFKIFLPVVIIVTIAIAVFGFKGIKDIDNELKNKSDYTLSLLASVSQEYILTREFSSLDSISEELAKDPDIVLITFYDTKGQEISKYQTKVLAKDMIPASSEIRDEENLIGSIKIGISLQKKKDMLLSTGITLGIMLIGIVVGILAAMNKVVVRPLKKLQGGAQKLSEGELGYQIEAKGKGEIAQTIGIFNKMSSRLNILTEENISMERLEKEFEMAALVQSSLLPLTFPSISGYDIFATCQMAQEAGGDLYDVIQISKNQYVLVIGDVSGKGMPAALYMSSAINMIRTEVTCLKGDETGNGNSANLSPGHLIKILNKLLKNVMSKGTFITIFMGILNNLEHTFTYSVAGHDPCVVYNPVRKDYTTIRTEGQACGVIGPSLFDRRVEEKTISIHQGDYFIFNTDGITEAKNARREQYMGRYEASIRALKGDGSAEQVVSHLLDGISDFVQEASQYDDMTLLCFKRL